MTVPLWLLDEPTTNLDTEGQRLVNKLLINGPAVSRETLKPLNVQEQRHLIELLSKII